MLHLLDALQLSCCGNYSRISNSSSWIPEDSNAEQYEQLGGTLEQYTLKNAPKTQTVEIAYFGLNPRQTHLRATAKIYKIDNGKTIKTTMFFHSFDI